MYNLLKPFQFMPQQNLSVSLTSQQKADVIARIIAAKVCMNFLNNLPSSNRKKYRKLAKKCRGYLSDVLDGTNANRNIISPSANMAEFRKDGHLCIDMAEIVAHLMPLFK